MTLNTKAHKFGALAATLWPMRKLDFDQLPATSSPVSPLVWNLMFILQKYLAWVHSHPNFNTLIIPKIPLIQFHLCKRPSPIEDTPTSGLILPKKVRGTPTMYADLQFPKSSNSGDLKRRARLENEIDRFLPKHKTEYGRIVFNPAFAERANLWSCKMLLFMCLSVYR